MNKTISYKTFQGKKLNYRKVSETIFTESYYQANLKMPMHNHRVPYISLVLQGGYKEKVSKKSCERLPNTIIFHPPNESHAIEFYQHPTRILRIEPQLEWIQQEDKFLKMFESSADFQKSPMNWIATRLYIEYKKNDEFSSLAIQGVMMELLAETGRIQAKQNRSNKIPKWLKKVQEILREEFNSKKSLDEIAKEVDVHPVYLSREFRRHFNCTIGEFVRCVRIEKACEKLSQSEKALSEIAFELGFYDQSHFTNTFKRIIGITPAEYRSNFQKS